MGFEEIRTFRLKCDGCGARKRFETTKASTAQAWPSLVNSRVELDLEGSGYGAIEFPDETERQRFECFLFGIGIREMIRGKEELPREYVLCAACLSSIQGWLGQCRIMDDAIFCERCHGTGLEGESDNVLCLKCQGKGRKTTKPKAKRKPNTEPTKCKSCDGEGTILPRYPDQVPEGEECFEERECEACDGSGLDRYGNGASQGELFGGEDE